MQMSAPEYHQVEWYLVEETTKARCFTKHPRGRKETFWVPRSLIQNFSKYPAQPQELPLCLMEVEEWFLVKEKLL